MNIRGSLFKYKLKEDPDLHKMIVMAIKIRLRNKTIPVY